MNKRGEALTSAQLIMIVLAIFGFIIILAFLTQFGKSNYSEQEICKVSVLARATAAEVKQGAQQIVPLQCITQKICLASSSSGECKQFQGEKNVAKIILPKASEGNAQQEEQQARMIEKQMAEAMYSCWDMMGQGKLDLFTTVTETYGAEFKIKKSTCVICSRVAIADDVLQSTLDRVNVKEYMERNVVPGTETTYLNAMSGSESYASFKTDSGNGSVNAGDISAKPASEREIAFIFMQIKTQEIGEVLGNQLQAAGVATGAGFMINPSGMLSSAKLFMNPEGLLTLAGVAGVVAGTGAISTYLNQMSAAGYCGDFVSSSKDEKNPKKGCSVLQAFPYSIDNINAFCGSIEGNVQ